MDINCTLYLFKYNHVCKTNIININPQIFILNEYLHIHSRDLDTFGNLKPLPLYPRLIIAPTNNQAQETVIIYDILNIL